MLWSSLGWRWKPVGTHSTYTYVPTRDRCTLMDVAVHEGRITLVGWTTKFKTKIITNLLFGLLLQYFLCIFGIVIIVFSLPVIIFIIIHSMRDRWSLCLIQVYCMCLKICAYVVKCGGSAAICEALVIKIWMLKDRRVQWLAKRWCVLLLSTCSC